MAFPELITYLQEKHPDHLILLQDSALNKVTKGAYFWEDTSYKYLTDTGVKPTPISADVSVLIRTVKEFCEKTQKSIIIIDNTIMLSPMYMIIHPIKTPSHDTPPNA